MRFNKRLVTNLGFLFVLVVAIILLNDYSYRSNSAIATTIQSTRQVIDSLDGEIEDSTNPDITAPIVAEASTTTSAGTNRSSSTSSQSAPKPVSQVRVGPDRLIIDKLGVNAYVQHVGLSRTGDMAVPTNFKDVGWFKLGAKPGEPGNVVIDGHLDNALGMPGVFKNLNKLQAGDIITVKNADGKLYKYRVSSKRSYGYNDNASSIFAKSGSKHLVLITCSGTWVQSERSYTDRLVVFADQI